MRSRRAPPSIAAIARRYTLKSVVLFGSRAQGRDRPKSDADVCVVGCRVRGDGLALQGELAQAFGCNVDLVRFEQAGPLLRFHAVFEGRLLWGDRRRFERLRLRVLKEWQDSRKIDAAVQASLD